MKVIKKYLNTLNENASINNISDINNLIQKHLQQLAFCNIPVLLDKDISLDLSKITEKMLENKEGGYCFEHNKLMYETLLYLGFEVKPLFGRVLNNQKKDGPKTHRMTLLTYANEKYIVDVGFGFMAPSQAIKFGVTPTKTILNTAYIIKEIDEETFEMQAVLDSDGYTLYSFDLHSYNEMDFEVGNFYSYKHPNANFVKNLVLSTISDTAIRSLRNKTYHIITRDEKKEVVISSLSQFSDILQTDFKYPISEKDAHFLFDKFLCD